MIDFEDVRDSIVQRMARRISVRPVAHQRFPFEASYVICPECDAVLGHAHRLEAHANTPAEAIDSVISMIALWLTQPTALELIATKADSETFAPGFDAEDGAVLQ